MPKNQTKPVADNPATDADAASAWGEEQHPSVTAANVAAGILPPPHTPSEAPEQEVSTPAKVWEHTFPATDAESRALLKQALAKVTKSSSEKKQQRDFIRALRHHILAFQRGLPAVRMDANALAKSNASNSTAADREAARLKLVQAALSNGDVVKLPAVRKVSEPLSLLPYERLMNEPHIRAQITNVANKLASYTVAVLSNRDLLDPEGLKDRLETEMSRERSPEKIRQLRDRIASLNGETDSTQRDAIKSALVRDYEPARAELTALLKSCKAALETYLAESVGEERSWAGRFGLPRTATDLSRRIESFAGKVVAHLNALEHPAMNPRMLESRTLPSTRNTVLSELFGLSLN